MLKKISILIILGLIISTTFIKNQTKRLDDEIFSIKENINYLKSVKELAELEHDYLSSPEKLIEYKNLYFEDELKNTPRDMIKIINNINQLSLNNLNKNE